MRDLLNALRGRLARSLRDRGARQIASNTGWLLGERAITLVISLFVQVWTARYLGPTDFGALSYAIAFIGLFGSFSYLGFTGVATRELVSSPEQHDEILGTAFLLKLLAALLAMTTAVIVIVVGGAEEGVGAVSLALACFLPFEAFSVISFWFHSRVFARPTVIATAVSGALVAVTKVGLIVAHAPVLWFAVATGVQSALTAVGLLVAYRKSGRSMLNWMTTRVRAKALLKESWPLAVAAVVASVYLKVDQVILGYLSDVEEVAVYAVAARLSEVWFVVPAAIATSYFPLIVKMRGLPERVSGPQMVRRYRLLFWMGVAIAVPVSLLAGPVVGLLYGEVYRSGGAILAIHIWACPAIFMGSIFTKWLIAEGFTTYALMRDVVSALLNVVLNFAMIPYWGGTGAAVATVISYSVSSYACAFFDRRTRVAGLQMTRALLLLPHREIVAPAGEGA